MRRQIIRAKAVLQENAQLKAALGLREKTDQAVAVGRIVGSSLRKHAPLRHPVGRAERRRDARNAGPHRRRPGRSGDRMPAPRPAGSCWSATDRTSSRRGSCAAERRSSPPGAATERSTSARSKSAATRSSAATSSSPRAPAASIRRSCPIARIVRLDDDGALAVPLADPGQIQFRASSSARSSPPRWPSPPTRRRIADGSRRPRPASRARSRAAPSAARPMFPPPPSSRPRRSAACRSFRSPAGGPMSDS